MILHFALLLSLAGHPVFGVDFDPDDLQVDVLEDGIIEGLLDETTNFSLRITSTDPNSSWSGKDIDVFFEPSHRFVTFENLSSQGNLGDIPHLIMTVNEKGYTRVYLKSDLIGIYDIKLYSKTAEPIDVKKYFKKILRLYISRVNKEQNQTINYIFALVIMLALFFMGMGVEMSEVLNLLRVPIGPAIGFVCQFVFMPLCAFILGKYILVQNYDKLGLLLVGSCPGGAASNFWTAMFHGDLTLSITMTLISSVSSFFMTTLWVYVFGSHYTDQEIKIPYDKLALSLATIAIPITLGALVKIFKARLAKRLHAFVARPFFFLCLIALPIVGGINSTYFFHLVTWRIAGCGILLGLLGFTFGALAALVFKQGRPQIIAISLETAIQNGGLAYVIMSVTLPSPIGDMGAIPIIAYFFCATGPMMLTAYVTRISYKVATGQITKETIRKDLQKAWDDFRGVEVAAVAQGQDVEQAQQEELVVLNTEQREQG